MKRYFFACLCAVAALAACDNNSSDGPAMVNLKVEINESELESPLEAYNVKLTNVGTTATETKTSVGNEASFTVTQGVYTILVTAVTEIDGEEINVMGSKTNVVLTGTDYTVQVNVLPQLPSPLIIKETYYTGCTFKTGEVDDNGVESESTYFRDQFHEIYNNSDEVVYADGLCIADTVFANYDFTQFYTWEIENADDYVFAQYIWQIEGNGTEFPIQPGESVIIAQWASNHKADVLTKGTSPVDLSSAEFETIEGPKELWNANITDGPAENLALKVNVLGYDLMQWLVPVGGANLVIFKPTTPLRTENFILASDGYNKGHEIALSDILDAVQFIDDENRIQTLGMPAFLDAGYIWCSGSYVGESIARKQAGTLANGKIKYKDTNNTTDDFEVQTTPMIRRNDAGIPSWNTWAN